MGGLRRALLILAGAFALAGLACAPARAHPHVFVDVDLEVEIGDDGVAKRLRYVWTFDDMYSAYIVQGLPRAQGKPTGEALDKLAEEIVEKLDAFDYFTSVAAEDHELQTIGAEEPRGSFEDGRLRLSFSVLLRAMKDNARKVNLRVFDPSYVVAVTLKDGVRLAGPTQCRHTMVKPGPLDARDAGQLDDSTRTNQLADNFGAKLATTVALDCSGAR